MRKTGIMAGTILLFWLIAGCSSTDCKNPPDCFQKGEELLGGGNRDHAYKFLAKAANDDPSNVNYQWAAARAAPNPKFALFHVKTAWDNGLRTKAVFETYLGLSRINDPTQSPFFALQLFSQLPDSIRTDDLRAGIFFSFKMYDSALVILQGLFADHPSPDLVNGIAKVHLAKNDNEKAAAFIIENRIAKRLNRDGYLLLNLAYLRTFDYAGCTAAFDAAKKDGFYDDELALTEARGAIAQGKLDEAEALLRPRLKVADDGKNSDLIKNFRSALAFIFFSRGDKAALVAIDSSLQGKSGDANPEQQLYRTLTKRLSDTASIIPALTGLFKKIPAYPEVQMVLAHELVRSGKNKEALLVFQNLPDVYLGSPRIIIERARLLDHSGKSDEALAMISLLHSRKIASKASLELFRDISIRKNLTDDAMKAQKILEKAYKSDVGVRWAKGMMYLKKGSADSAILVFSALKDEFPKEPRFFLALLNACYSDKNYDRVIRECSGNPSNALPVERLLARSYAKKGKIETADSIYRVAFESNKKDGTIGMEYAEFLLHNKKPLKAAEIYRDLIDKKTGAPGGDSGKAAAIALNNLAWSLLQTKGADKEIVLSAIKKAYAIDNTNLSILDTYAEALLRFERYDDCVDLLENSYVAKKNGGLLLRLAEAFEKSGKANKAVRTLQDAEKLFENDKIKKEAIRQRIEKIIAGK